jgi:hypothetical protein
LAALIADTGSPARKKRRKIINQLCEKTEDDTMTLTWLRDYATLAVTAAIQSRAGAE